jgi:transcriptional regulator with XRE-family HTH domain
VSKEACATPARARGQLLRRASARYDLQIARRVREQRIHMGLSRAQVAVAIGVSQQQVHKYETCINRITAGHLYAMAQILGATVADFFVGLKPTAAAPPARKQVEIMHAVARIRDQRRRAAICTVVRVMAHVETHARKDGD